MNKLILAALLCLPAAAWSQEEPAKPAADEIGAPPPARPNPQKIMAEISAALRLSSKQEDRIAAAVNKRAQEFDKLMREYERSSAEEKKWRFKMNDARRDMVKLTRDLPDTVREFLDDEQNETFDEMLAEKRGAAPAAAAEAPKAKRKVLKRKKAPAPEAAPAEEGAGEEGVMVDSEKPAPKKKLVKRKKAAAPAEEAATEAAKPAEKEAPPAEEEAGSYP